MVSVTTIQLCLRSLKAAIDNMSMNEHGCVPIKVLFMGTEIVILYSFYVSWSILWIFFNHLINANTILSSWAKWKQELDWIWLADHDLPTSVLDHTGKIWMFEVNFFFNLIEWHNKRRGHYEITWRIMIKKMLHGTFGNY